MREDEQRYYEDKAERRIYALLQAAAFIYGAWDRNADTAEGPIIAFSVSAAEELLKRIEQRFV